MFHGYFTVLSPVYEKYGCVCLVDVFYRRDIPEPHGTTSPAHKTCGLKQGKPWKPEVLFHPVGKKLSQVGHGSVNYVEVNAVKFCRVQKTYGRPHGFAMHADYPVLPLFIFNPVNAGLKVVLFIPAECDIVSAAFPVITAVKHEGVIPT